MKKFLCFIAIILVIVLAGYFAGKYLEAVQTNADNINKNEVKDVVNQVKDKITNEYKNVVNNVQEDKEENVIENTVTNTVTNDVEEEKEPEKEETKTPAANVGQTGEDDRQKAINIAKKEWGEDDNVSFKIDEQSEDGKFVISVVDKNTTKVVFWYSVDVKNNTIEEK